MNVEPTGRWRVRRREQAEDRRALGYCAGCKGFPGSQVFATHMIDFIMEPEAAVGGIAGVSQAPWTYLNRIFLKKRLKQWMPDGIFHEMPDSSTLYL